MKWKKKSVVSISKRLHKMNLKMKWWTRVQGFKPND
jgi:hypothetical protein